MLENLDFELFEHQGGFNMLIKVIFPDGTIGTVKFTTLTNLIKLGKIVAFECSEGWIEARRKRNGENYFGPERRRANLVTINSQGGFHVP